MPVLATVAVASAGPGAAQASSGLVRAGTISLGLASDGDRRVAYGTADRRHVVVLDTVSGRRHRVRRPNPCITVMELAGSRLLMGCYRRHGAGSEWEPRLVSATSGRMLRSRGATSLRRRITACSSDRKCSFFPKGFGRHWIRMEWWDHGVNPTRITWDYTNLETGRVRRGSDSATETEDLDHPRLVRRLCSPLERRPYGEQTPGNDPRWVTLYAAGRYGMALEWSSFAVRTCGRRRPVLQRDAAAGIGLTPLHAVWLTRPGPSHDQRLHVTRLSNGRTRTWASEPFLGRFSSPAYALTRNRLYVRDLRPRPGHRWTLYRGLLP